MNIKVQFYSGSNWVTVAKFSVYAYATDFVASQSRTTSWRIREIIKLERL